jgi:shikimate dehydrogenase
MDRMYFIGVDTAGSQIRRIFPRWAEALGLRAELVGRDIPLGAAPDAFRQAVDELHADPLARGALVTTHKVSIYRHAGDRFASLDQWSRLCGEVSCIAKRDHRLLGWAKDPITSWQAFVDVAGADYFARHPRAEVLCLGAGGSGTAFTTRLLHVEPGPARITVTNRSPERLRVLREIHARVNRPIPVEYYCVGKVEESDALVNALPPFSVVVNATGLGKDRPGSPISDAARFPEQGIAWEFNYRGDLLFLAQARRQAAERGLVVEDGWRYFLYGWTSHIGEVFALNIDPPTFARLAALAAPLHEAAPTGPGRATLSAPE